MNKKKLLKEIFSEVHSLSEQGFSDKEIDRAINEAFGDFGLSDIFGGLTSIGGKAMDMGSDLVQGITDLPSKAKNVANTVTSVGKSVGTGLIETFKKQIAKYLVSKLNIDPNSFMALVIVNFFVNLDFRDYKKVFADCEFTCSLLSESLVDALIEQMRIKLNLDSITYSVIQDTVMDQLKQVDTIQAISDKLNGFVCPHLQDARNMILGKAPWIEPFV